MRTNREFYGTQEAIDAAFSRIGCCREKCIACEIGDLARENLFGENGKPKSCKEIWLDMPYPMDLPDKVDVRECVHFRSLTPSGSLNICGHPQLACGNVACGFRNAKDCPHSAFKSAADSESKQSSPATESDPNGLKPSDPGAKLDSGKNMLGLVLDGFAPAIVEVGKVGTYGASKYSPNGWKSVEGAKRRYMDALMRHLFAHLTGEKTDKESGLTHLAHAAWNVLALLTFEIKGGGE